MWRHASPVGRKLREEQPVIKAPGRLELWKPAGAADKSSVSLELDFPSRGNGRGCVDNIKAANNRRERSREVQVCFPLAASRLASPLWMLTFSLRKFSRCSFAAGTTYTHIYYCILNIRSSYILVTPFDVAPLSVLCCWCQSWRNRRVKMLFLHLPWTKKKKKLLCVTLTLFTVNKIFYLYFVQQSPTEVHRWHFRSGAVSNNRSSTQTYSKHIR